MRVMKKGDTHVKSEKNGGLRDLLERLSAEEGRYKIPKIKGGEKKKK